MNKLSKLAETQEFDYFAYGIGLGAFLFSGHGFLNIIGLVLIIIIWLKRKAKANIDSEAQNV